MLQSDWHCTFYVHTLQTQLRKSSGYVVIIALNRMHVDCVHIRVRQVRRDVTRGVLLGQVIVDVEHLAQSVAVMQAYGTEIHTVAVSACR